MNLFLFCLSRGCLLISCASVSELALVGVLNDGSLQRARHTIDSFPLEEAEQEGKRREKRKEYMTYSQRVHQAAPPQRWRAGRLNRQHPTTNMPKKKDRRGLTGKLNILPSTEGIRPAPWSRSGDSPCRSDVPGAGRVARSGARADVSCCCGCGYCCCRCCWTWLFILGGGSCTQGDRDLELWMLHVRGYCTPTEPY